MLGGFSMGGAMGMQLSYRFLPQVAGVFGMSCFLNERSNVYEVIFLPIFLHYFTLNFY